MKIDPIAVETSLVDKMSSKLAATDEKDPATNARRKGPWYADLNGFLFPGGFPLDALASGLRYEAQANDLFIATYAKSGTTWMQHIVYTLMNGGVPILPHESLGEKVPFLEMMGADTVRAMSKANTFPYMPIKVHLPYELTPKHENAKYIVVVRNPKDVVVSFYHHTRGFPQVYDYADGPFDVYYDLFLEGKVDFNSYFDTVKSWMAHRNDPNVLMLKYEDMRRDPHTAVQKVASFMDITVDSAMVDSVVEHTSFDSMKKDFQRWTGDQRSPDHEPFVRKGSVAGYWELLSEEQAAKLDAKMMERFTKEELDLLGEVYYKSELPKSTK